jgi:hypothetical protein
VKRIVVHSGAALSLQSHHHRAEHWIVVQGTAKVTVDEEIKLVTENQSVYIPLGAVHRMENPGKVPLTLIEVQTGSYLGEDDIIRYEDVYARRQRGKMLADLAGLKGRVICREITIQRAENPLQLNPIARRQRHHRLQPEGRGFRYISEHPTEVLSRRADSFRSYHGAASWVVSTGLRHLSAAY